MTDASDGPEEDGGRLTVPSHGRPSEEGIPEPGRRLGDFRLVQEVGRGSMGIVYESIQEPLHRRVALKVLPLTVHLQQQTLKRFLREAAVLAELDHPHIVPIYATGSDRGVYFYAMPFLDGPTLDKALKSRRPGIAETCSSIAAVADALHVAHEKGIVHRDVKPGNLIYDSSGKLLVADFGLARQDKAGTITESGALVGTPMYMSPEQVSAARTEIDRRSDVYSLGATLYEMVSGQPPFDADNVQTLLRLIVEQEPRSVRRIDRSIPKDVETIVRKAMSKEPARRYQTAKALAEDLRRALDGRPILARPASLIERTVKGALRHRVPVAAGAVVLAAIGAAGTFYLQGRSSKAEADYRAAISEARVQLFTGNQALAEELYSKAVGLFPERPEGLLGRAQLKAERGSHADAKTDYDRVLARDAENYDALVGRGSARLELGDVAGAEADLVRANELHHDRAAGCRALADLRLLSSPEQAVGLYRKAHDLEPDDDETMRKLGLAYEKLGNLRLATTYLLLAVRADKKNAENVSEWDRLMRRAEAREFANKLSASLGPLTETIIDAGRLAVETVGGEIGSFTSGVAERSERALSAAGSFARGVSDALLAGRGADQDRSGMDRAALDRAIETEPTNARALVDRAYLEIADREYKGAENDLSLARDLTPNAPEPEIGLALLYLRADSPEWRRPEKAVECARAALKKGGDSPAARLVLAEGLIESGNAADAISEIERVLALPEPLPERPRARELLDRARARPGEKAEDPPPKDRSREE